MKKRVMFGPFIWIIYSDQVECSDAAMLMAGALGLLCRCDKRGEDFLDI